MSSFKLYFRRMKYTEKIREKNILTKYGIWIAKESNNFSCMFAIFFTKCDKLKTAQLFITESYDIA